MIGSVATVGSGTLLSRAFGFIRDTLVAAILGAGPLADAFFAAFQLLNVARRFLAEGALNAALVPAYLKAQGKGPDTATHFAGRILGTVSVGLFALALLLGLAMPLVIAVIAPGFQVDPRLAAAVENARLMLPFLALGGPVTVLTGLLNAEHRFTVAAFVPVLFNLMLIVVIIVLIATHASAAQAGFALSVTIGVVGFIQAAVLMWHARTVGITARPLAVSLDPEMRIFIKRAIPGMIAATLPQVVLVIAVMQASHLPGAVSWLYFANRLFELPIGIVGAALGTVMVPAITRALRDNDHSAIVLAEQRALELAAGLTLPAAIGLGLLSEPIVHTLFEHGAFTGRDTVQTSWALAMLAVGLPGYVLTKSLAPAFFARDNTMIPMQATLIGLGVMIVTGWILQYFAGATGIAAAIALSGWASTAYLVLRRRQHFHEAFHAGPSRLPRILIANVAMAIGLWIAPQMVDVAIPGRLGDIVALFGQILLGLAIYGAMLAALGVLPMAFLLRVMRRDS